MDDATIARLNQINRDFYRVTAENFDQTRGKAWPGWEKLLPYIKRPLSVLDVGCGNGRFGVFVAEKLLQSKPSNPIRYHGIDNNPVLLERARQTLGNMPGITATFEERDIVENPPDFGEHGLVVLFGVIHHIPGAVQRKAFMRTLAERVAPGGMLAFACWRFYEYERFRKRITAWPDDVQVEEHDYLLDWRRGEVALRYCHYVDDDEHAQLVSAAGLPEITTYRTDGFTGEVNRYSLLKRLSTSD